MIADFASSLIAPGIGQEISGARSIQCYLYSEYQSLVSEMDGNSGDVMSPVAESIKHLYGDLSCYRIIFDLEAGSICLSLAKC